MRAWAYGLSVVALAGCGGLDDLFGGSNSGLDGGMVSFGRPTLEVTINGVHAGPADPDATASSYFRDTQDSFGNFLSSVFGVTASASSVGAACNFELQRFGAQIAPIGTGMFMVESTSSSETGDALSPGSGISVSSPQGTYTCAGSDCNNSVLNLSALASDHSEGYWIGNSPAGDTITCTFYLAMSAYVP